MYVLLAHQTPPSKLDKEAYSCSSNNIEFVHGNFEKILANLIGWKGNLPILPKSSLSENDLFIQADWLVLDLSNYSQASWGKLNAVNALANDF